MTFEMIYEMAHIKRKRCFFLARERVKLF